MSDKKLRRRDFLRASGQAAGLMAFTPLHEAVAAARESAIRGGLPEYARGFGTSYTGTALDQVAFPMGGIGAGMICLDGTGALSHVSIRNHPEMFNEPCVFAAVSVKKEGVVARVLEGPVPARKIFGLPDSGDGDVRTTYGLPRFEKVSFEARFPFGRVSLADADFPLTVELTGWSPFEPGDADNSSLPVAALEYVFTNPTDEPIEAMFSFNATNFLNVEGCPNAVRPIEGGFVLWNGPGAQAAWQEVALSAVVKSTDVKVNYCWFRGQWWDAFTMAWKDVENCACFDSETVQESSPGATLFVPLDLLPGASKRVVLQLAWYCGRSSLRYGEDPPGVAKRNDDTYSPWYAGRFEDINRVTAYWSTHFEELRARTLRFSSCFYDTTLPPEVIEAVAANLTILKSPTVLRQTDGKLWGWEGCHDNVGSCEGSCTHVWNYAQSIAHLFPELERSLRETEFGPSQNEEGRQLFRSALPIRRAIPGEADATDGQLGGIIKSYREWRISGGENWLKAHWPQIKRSLDYCIRTWDPRHVGLIEEPHHTTYDIEFWGPEPLCSALYLGALQAAVLMSRALGEDASFYEALIKKGKVRMESELFNGEYFYQKVQLDHLNASLPTAARDGTPYSREAGALVAKEGPNYQYHTGCLSDGMLGVWLASMCGVPHPLDPEKVVSHMRSVHRYNMRADLSACSNTQRPNYALGKEGGVLLCSWPKGGKPSLPLVFSDEVWTGIEYQVASHLIEMGLVQEGLEIVRTCRARYNSGVRNPFDEYECGHWYARAMSSYGLLQALTGARYDALEKTLYLKPVISGDFNSFLSTATGYGTVGVLEGKPFLNVITGSIPCQKVVYVAAKGRSAV